MPTDRATTWLIILVVLLSACSSPAPGPTSIDFDKALGFDPADRPPLPELDPEAVDRGAVIYAEQCAACHKADASGEPDWKTPNADGSFKPPPHDPTGHTWHHSDQLLAEIVANGGGFEGSQMPALGGVLTPEDIAAVLEYLKSLWGPEERDFQWQQTWQAEQLSR